MDREPTTIFLELDDPSVVGLPPEEAGSMLVAFAVVQLAGERVTAVVDHGTGVLLAHAAAQEDFLTTPLNLATVRWMRPGWPTDWERLDEPTHWLRREGAVWVRRGSSDG